MTRNLLEVDRLTVALPSGGDRALALDNVSFEMERGQVLCLVGESGSGKSIAAHTIMGLLPGNVRPIGGCVLLEGEDLLKVSSQRMRKLFGEKIAMIFQEPMSALNPVMTCGGQIDEMLAQHTAVSSIQRRKRVLGMMERVRLPDVERVYGAYPHQLSGGQLQRIMIAMALILRPALLIADEPTSALDVTTQAEILRLIRELQRENGTAVLFVTHDLGVVAEIADTVAVLRQGEIVESGSARRIFTSPSHSYTCLLLDAVPDLIPRKESSPSDSPILLRARGLTKVFASGGWLRTTRRVVAADSVDLEVRTGETLGIVGESGSGKSTLARLIAKLLAQSAGEVHLLDDELNLPARAFRRRVQVVFQDPFRSLNPRRTVGEAIVEGPLNYGTNRADAWKRAGELMEMVKLAPTALGRYPHEFSGGQRQRICIARALAIGPELLIADEAVSALDVSVQAQILALFEELRRHLNLTLLFVTHDLRVAAQICNTLVVMQHGRVVERGSAAQVLKNPEQPYTRALIQAVPGRSQFAPGIDVSRL